MNSIENKEELPEYWNVPVTAPVHKKGYKSDSSNYSWLSLLSSPLTIFAISSFQD
jgi:hypothetical protein